MMSLTDIRSAFKGVIRLNEPIGAATSFGVGGSCDYYFEPVSPEDARSLVACLAERQMPVLLLARGSNLLVSDEGFRGAAVRLEQACGAVHLQGGTGSERIVVAGAGARLARVTGFCAQHGIAGLEEFAGIPGTVAGAVLEDPECGGVPLRTLVEEVVVVRGGQRLALRRSGAGLRLRTGGPGGRDVLLSLSFRLREGDTGTLLRARREVLLRRNAERPLNMPRAGIVFRDPAGGARAVELLRRAGCAGMRRGGAMAAESHPNYIVTDPGRTRAAEVLALAGAMQRAVHERTGVELALLARPVGFAGSSLREVA